jgi:hypothetical protein
MLPILHERRYTLTQLAKREDVAVSTTWRWTRRGIRGIRLETLRVGGRDYTTDTLWARFVLATTAAANGGSGVHGISKPGAAAHVAETAYLAAELD